MDSFGNVIPIISQLIGQLTARDRNCQSKAELEVMVRSVVGDCLQQQAGAERREIMSSLMDVMKEIAVRPAETRRDPELDDLLKKLKEMNVGKDKKQSGRDEVQSQKQIVMEVLQEMLNDQKSGKNNDRGRTRERTDKNNFVLPWCDKPDNNSQAKYSGKGKQFSERKGSDDAQGKNFKDQGAYEKKSFDSQQKNFNDGRGTFRGKNQSVSSDRVRTREGAVPLNNMPRGGRGYGNDQHFSGRNQHQHRQQEGAVGYGSPMGAQQQRPASNHMYQQPFGIAPLLANNYQPGPANQNYQPGPGNQNYQAGPMPQNYYLGAANYNVDNFNHGDFPRPQFGNSHAQPFPQPPHNYPNFRNNGVQQQHQSFQRADAPYGENVNYQQTQKVFSQRGNNFRGRGGFQRGGPYNRGGYANRPNSDMHRSFTDITDNLSPEEFATIKNVLRDDASNVHSKKSNKDKVVFKPKKKNVSGKPNEDDEDDDDQEEDEAKNLPTNENKVFEDKLSNNTKSTGPKKKKVTKKNAKPDDDQKPKEAGVNQSGAAAGKNVTLVGLGINKNVLKNVDENQEIKNVILIDRSDDKNKTFQPKTVGEFKEYMEKYPITEAIIKTD